MQTRFNAPTIQLAKRRESDLRLGDLIQQQSPDADDTQRQIVLIGFPVDEGVRRNGGRVGAAAAPDAIRTALFRLTPDPRIPCFEELLRSVVDWGNVATSDDLESDQEGLSEIVAYCLEQELTPVILGGGHETSFGHFLGYARADKRVAIVNVDAHPDVRPMTEVGGHSGSPFRQAILHESGAVSSYSVFGLAPHACQPSLIDFIKAHGGYVRWRDDIILADFEAHLGKIETNCLATMDLDALDQSIASGVSAPNPHGLCKSLWLGMAELMGRSQTTRSFDLVEYNPQFDCDAQTARVAALTIWYFLRGYSSRTGCQP